VICVALYFVTGDAAIRHPRSALRARSNRCSDSANEMDKAYPVLMVWLVFYAIAIAGALTSTP
jgi:hypothetical protein